MDGDAARQRAAQRNEEMMGASGVECTQSSAVQRRGSASLGDDVGCGAGRWLNWGGLSCRSEQCLKATRDLVAVRVASYESIAGFFGANFGEWVWAWCLEEMRSSRNVDQEGPSLSNPGDGVDAPIAALSLSNGEWGAKRRDLKMDVHAYPEIHAYALESSTGETHTAASQVRMAAMRMRQGAKLPSFRNVSTNPTCQHLIDTLGA
ncbi:hypothetical protein SUNI508_12852 [Seiridium unicorne]|uniref:Uncharacterized protein n=1 Tax=Seiridium unicorne TaxID=138068 RepID=A0ABR2VGA3_9PEZI